jgi:hypothetical protein
MASLLYVFIKLFLGDAVIVFSRKAVYQLKQQIETATQVLLQFISIGN